ncbi:immunoglobulin-like domain-containing protein [Sphaerotilus sp.]|uniref:immunoglobulin-like domain-containing protein n=1 Tax=Sphaerotilus sp. TaxID=2093942 RepID=UPI002ACE321D|nr:immunoglobulin-like domain-containing protein [Sphaerotilus sp.]MDZ7857471.1 immunoglobulin-like domain-containing protein [Sphaerotilus sp.]
MPASKSAAASPAARASSSHSDAAHRQEPPTLNVHYVPARMPAGVVTGLWGGAVRREDDGSTTPLKLGDVVRKGDVLLTEQRGIVQLTVDGKQFLTTGDPELDKLVARLDDGELDFVTGAGGEGGEGSLQAGLIVDRVIEVVSPQEYQYAYDQYRQGADLFQGASGQTARPVFEEADIVVSLDGPTNVIEGQTAANYTVTLSNPAPVDVTVTLAYAGVATAGQDFTPVLSVTVPAGQTSVRFDIPTLDDALAEGSEPFTATIVSVSGHNAAIVSIDPERASVTTTITDDAGPSGPGTPGAEDTCLVSITGPDSVVEGEVATGYTVSLSQPAVTDVVVKLTYSGTATDGSDYTAVTSVTIPAGQSSATFDIATIDDALAEGSESFTVSLGEITGGGFEQIAGDPGKATITTTITDDAGPSGPGTPGAEDTCLVSISGPDSVVEGEVATGYTVSLSQPAVTDVVVKLTYSGTATDGSDYTAVTSVTIPAGQSSATFDIATIDDALAEDSESFTVSLGEITGGGFEAIAGDPAKATVTTSITDDAGPSDPGTPGAEDTCLVSISGPDSVVEGETAPGYTVSLSQPAVTDVVVKLTYSGTATDGSDFTAVTSVTIPAGQSSATFDIATIDDALAEGTESFTVSLGEITGGGFEAIAGDPGKATVTTSITDDAGPSGPGTPGTEDTCLVSISGPDSVVEGEVAPGYIVSLSQPAVTDVIVKLTYSGTATDGSDYTAVTSVTIPAGQSSATFDLATIDDALAEGTEAITVSLGEITGGGFEAIAGDPAKASVTTSLTDDTGPKGPEDTCFVSITGPDSVVEGEVAPGYTVSLSQPAVTDVVVKLTYSGTATDGSDYTAVTSVTIPAGQSSATFDLATIDDALAEGSESFTVSLGEITGGGFEVIAGDPGKATITTTITDDAGPSGPGTPGAEDTCLVSISGPDSVVEGEVALGYTVSLSQPAVTDVVVKLTYSGTATDGSDFTAVTSVTIPAGQSSATFDIATIDDALVESPETLTISLGEITGGGFEQIAGDPAKASITTSLTDDTGPKGLEDTCLVSITGPDSVVEGETAPGYTVSLSQPAVTDVVVKLTYSGTATDGSDFTAVTSVTIPAGQSSATFDIATIDDALVESPETLTISLGEITGGGFEQIAGDPAKASITTSLTDDTGPKGLEDTCLVSITGPGSVIEGEVAPGYTVSLSQPAVTDVVVKLTYSGTATDGSDFTAVTSVTIPAGQSSATFDLATIDDALAESPETLTISLGEITGGGFEQIAGDPAKASITTSLTDDTGPKGPEDTCFVSISGPDSVVEGETAPGYTVSLSQPAVTDVVVKLTYSGTATGGSDYTAVTSVTIPAGQSSATFDIATIDDALAEGSESFTVSLGEITGGGFEAIAGDPAKASVTTSLTDDTGPKGPEDTCFVSITGPDSVVEGEVAPGYTVSLSQPAVTDVVVKLTYSGTATDGSDYTSVTSVTIPAGQSSATFDIATIDDALAEGTEAITISLGEITGGGFEAIAGDPAKATVTTSITDDAGPSGPGTPGAEDTCLVSITGPGSVVEGEVATGYTVSLSQPAVTDVVVKLTYSGTATDGSDYTAVTSVTITAGESSATFDIATIDDALAESPETLTISLGEITGGGFEAIAGDPAKVSVTTSLTDDTGPKGPEDTCFVSISGPDSVVEGETAPGYTVSLSQPAVTDVVVKLTYSGTATDGSDYTAVTSVTIPAGQSSATFDLATIDDALAEGTEAITVSLGEITGGGFEAIAGDPAKASVTTSLTDDTGPKGPEDTCLVSISGPGSVIEGEVASGYTVSLSQPAVTDVVVKLTYSGTATDGSDYTAITSITIPAGQSSATFDIATIDDALAEGTESFTVSLGEITGGGFEQIAGDPAKAAITTTLSDDTGPKGPEDTCLVSITGPGTVVEGEIASGYTVTLSQASTSSVTVELRYSGTAESGIDFTKVATVTIPPGVTSYSFGISTTDDALAEGTEQFDVTLGAITGGSFEAIVADPAQTTVSTCILDDTGPLAPNGPGTPGEADRVLVSITGPESVIEGETSGAYVVSLSQPAAADVVVRLVYSGTAADGVDYVRTSSVTIAAGQSSTTFHLATVDDALAEGTETITVALGPISGGGFEEIAGDPAKASVTTLLHDDSGPQAPGGGQPPDGNDTVLVSLTGPDTVLEGETASGYTVTLSQAALSDVQITLTYSGTATAGADYTQVLSVTVPAGQTSVRFDLPTRDDALAEGNETLIVALDTITGGGFEAVLANPLATSVTTSLVDDVGPGGAKPGAEDTVQVSLTGPGQVLEGEIATGYTISLSQAAVTDVVVKLNYSGTATDGSDYTRVATVTIPAGQTSARFDIATLPDGAAEGAETYTVALGAISGGGFEEIRGNPAAYSVTTTITDTAHAPTPLADQGVAREDTPVSGNVLDNDRDPDGDPLSVTGFTWGDIAHPVGTTATLPGIGTLVVEPDGRYTFQPAKDYTGPVPEVSCVISDGALTSVSTLTLSITPVNDAPTLRGGSATLSEEGLAGGLPDSATETRATQATGTLQFSDVDSPSLRFTLEAPTGLYASGGKALVWSGDGSAEHPLLGTAGGQVVLRATIDGQGRYTVELQGPLDHPVRNTEDTLTLSLGVQVSDGESSSMATLDVTVRDDSPTPFCTTRCADLHVVQNNLLITLDVSGSMGTRDGVNGETRLQSAIKSITKLIDSYDQQGEVAVRLVTFSTSASERGDQWMSVAQAKSTLAALSAGGNTNYDAALDTARGAFTDSGRLDGGHNVAYFFSDGRPNLPTQDVGIDAGEAKVWQDFLNQHDIQSYAIGLGRDVPVSALDPVAWNGVTGTDDLSPLLVSSFTQLDAVLAHTVAPAVSGEVVDGGLKSITGADGGHLSDIVVNGVHHPWDPATSASDTVSIKTAAGGEFTFNMETGHYTYQGPVGTRPDYQEVLQFTVTDGDGDSRSGQMTLKVNADGSSAFDGYCAPAAPTSSTCLSGGVLSWTLADHSGDSKSGQDSQCTTTNLQLGDVLGSGSHDTLTSWSGSGCAPSSGSSTSSGGDTCLGGSTVDLQLAQTLIKQTADTLQNC